MTLRRAGQFALGSILGFVLAVELYNFSSGTLSLAAAWFPTLLCGLGLFAVVFRSCRDASFVLGLLLASVSVLLSSITPYELLVLGEWSGQLARFTWESLIWVFPFVFLHFSLVFPVRSQWIDRGRHRLLLLYLPFGIAVALGLAEPTARLIGGLPLILIVSTGFLLGLGIFVRQYLYSLTTAERNRLRFVLAGCFAGAVPKFLSALGGDLVPPFAQDASSLLLPLFPLSLALAVLHENFSDLGKPGRVLLVVFFLLGGTVTVFFVSTLLLSALVRPWPSTWITLFSIVAAACVAYPLKRWAAKYVSSRFSYVPSDSIKGIVRPREFRPILPNPFIVGNPVRSPDMFFGRRSEFDYVRATLGDQRQGCIIVLTGERRTGKTSILYQISGGRLGEGYVSVFLDMQGLIVENDRELLTILASRIQEACPKTDLQSKDYFRETPFVGFSNFLSGSLSRLGRQRLLLLIDEYELIEERISSGKLSREVPNFLNSLLEANSSLSLVLTGSRSLDLKPLWRPLLAKSSHKEISFLDRSDAEDLIRLPLLGKAVFKLSVLEAIIRLTNGHPFFTQLVGQTLVDVLNEEEKVEVDKSIFGEVVERIVENPPPQLLYRWDGFSAGEKLTLAGLATVLRSDKDYAVSERIHNLMCSIPDKYREPMDLTRIRMHLEGLRQKKVVDRDQSRYRFTMDLFRVWIKRDHTVWGVLAQITSV